MSWEDRKCDSWVHVTITNLKISPRSGSSVEWAQLRGGFDHGKSCQLFSGFPDSLGTTLTSWSLSNIYLHRCACKKDLHLWSLISWQMCLALLCLRTASLLICFLSFFTACQFVGFAIKWWFKKKYQCVHLDDHIGVCCQQIVEISKSTFQIGSWKEQSSLPCSTAVARMMITKPCGFLNFLKSESCSV